MQFFQVHVFMGNSLRPKVTHYCPFVPQKRILCRGATHYTPKSQHIEDTFRMNTPISVIIVGGGPTGLCAANLLGLAGINTLIIERNKQLSNYPKAISLDDEGLRIFQAMGLEAAIRHCLLTNIHAHYFSGKRIFAKVTPTSKSNGYPLISTFNQPELETALLDGLKRFACVSMLFQHTMETFTQTEERVIVSVRTPQGSLQTFECAYLLACDGGRSSIRQALNIPMQGATYGQKWLVVDCAADDDASPIAKFFCDPQRPAVTVPSPHQGRRWEFMLLPGETEQELLSTETARTLIRQAGGSAQPQIIRKAIYTFHATLAQRLSAGRVFLLGDAAHMMPPFGGQGLNCGLRDAHNLCWKLAMVLQNLAHPSLLETYSTERHPHVAQMIFFSSLLGNIVMPTNKLLAFSRDRLFSVLNTIPTTRSYLSEARIKPQPRYTAGFFIRGGRASKGIAGSMLPQPEVIDTEGQPILLDELLGPGFAILALHTHPDRAYAALRHPLWQRLGTRIIFMQPHANTNNASSLSPKSGSVPSFTVVTSNGTHFLPTQRNFFVVVRPDRYVLGTFTEETADRFVASFQKLLCHTT